MAKVKCKGTVISQTITTTLTPIAQIIDFNHGSAESETFDCTTLDSGVGKEYSQTGYSEPGNFSMSLFMDPALAGHQSLTDDVTTPTNRVYSIAFADAATTTSTFTAAGIGVGFTGAMNDGLKMDVDLKLTGLFTYPT